MKIHLLGTVGWHPNDTRHTACVMIPELGVVFDAGSGFFRVPKLVETEELHIFLSHYHWDHIIGLISLMQLSVKGKVKAVHIYGKPTITQIDILFMNPFFPIPMEEHPFDIVLHEWDEGSPVWNVGDMTFETGLFPHPSDGSLGYSLIANGKKVVYLTDMSVSSAAIPLAMGADLLICEANFTHKEHPMAQKTGHTTAKEAAELAEKASVGKLVLTHLNTLEDLYPPEDIFKEAKEIFSETILGEDKLVIEI